MANERLDAMVGKERTQTCNSTICKGKETQYTFCKSTGWGPDKYFWQCNECEKKQVVQQ